MGICYCRYKAHRFLRSAWSVHVDGDLPNGEVSTVDSGDWLTLESERHWIGFARIASVRAPLFNAPRADARSSYRLFLGPVEALSTFIRNCSSQRFLIGVWVTRLIRSALTCSTFPLCRTGMFGFQSI